MDDQRTPTGEGAAQVADDSIQVIRWDATLWASHGLEVEGGWLHSYQARTVPLEGDEGAERPCPVRLESTDLAYAEKGERNWEVGYRVIGRLTIHATGATYTEAAVGMANLPDVGEAHDMAVKTAESDAFKRAAINLGDQFGLSLYKNGQTSPVVIGTITQDGPDNDNA